jgi:MoaA/NifB/PqqE/SkfB family radical SAM enzyme
MVDAARLGEYEATRIPGVDRSVLCHAPFVSLNFDQSGRVTACCYNRAFVLGTYPQQSVREIWAGALAEELRDAFRTGGTARGCDACFNQIHSGNYAGVLMRNFDRFAVGPAARTGGAAPLVLEFEIANTCSLECVMCGGHWSSAIRERREKLPPLRSPYDAGFAAQIEEILPTVVAAKFLGGEPFLITRYYEIWDSIRRVNPDVDVSITTSGAVLPPRARQLLESLRASLVISLDGATRTTYEAIRRNASFDQVMTNLDYLSDYVSRRGTSLTLAACPLQENWRELRAIVDLAEARRASVFFNTVTRPVRSSLAGCSTAQLDEIIAHLESEGRETAGDWTPASRRQWDGLISQLRDWLASKRAFDEQCREVAAGLRVATVGTTTLRHPIDRDRLHPILDGLALARTAEWRRGIAAHQPEEACWLPEPPIPLWPPALTPSTAELVAAVQILLDCSDSGTTDQQIPARDRSAGAVALLGTMGDGAEADDLGTWIRTRCEAADVETVCELARLLFDYLGANPAGLGQFRADFRRRLSAAWTDFEQSESREATRRQVAGFLQTLMARLLPVRFLDVSPPQPAAPEADRVHDPAALMAALRAMAIYRHVMPSTPRAEAFQRRLQAVMPLLTATASAQLVEALRQFDVIQIYAFLDRASDEQVSGVLAAVS